MRLSGLGIDVRRRLLLHPLRGWLRDGRLLFSLYTASFYHRDKVPRAWLSETAATVNNPPLANAVPGLVFGVSEVHDKPFRVFLKRGQAPAAQQGHALVSSPPAPSQPQAYPASGAYAPSQPAAGAPQAYPASGAYAQSQPAAGVLQSRFARWRWRALTRRQSGCPGAGTVSAAAPISAVGPVSA